MRRYTFEVVIESDATSRSIAREAAFNAISSAGVNELAAPHRMVSVSLKTDQLIDEDEPDGQTPCQPSN